MFTYIYIYIQCNLRQPYKWGFPGQFQFHVNASFQIKVAYLNELIFHDSADRYFDI